jgi:aspartyl-tRNA synthetase
MCGEPRSGHVGRVVTLAGWAARRRDHGGLVFVDLRDHTGLCQVVVNPERAPQAAELVKDVRNEFVLQATGEIVARSPETVNPKMATGEVELQVDELTIVSRSTPLPFQLDEEGVDETLRLRYRWLDLRRERMQRNLRLAGAVVSAIRRRMEELGFVDLWTPSLTRATPEGARDFLVPVRLQPGSFFALPQSPQIFKQLLMISGFDRYYQIATCFRDEDLRADRQFEFRQLDVELAFAQREDVLDVLERAVCAAFEALEREPPEVPFPRRPWSEVMARYGSDKPDLRFGLEIRDATEVTRGSSFGVFANEPCVRFVVAPKAFSRGELARLEELVEEWGAKGLAYLVVDEAGEVRSPISKFLSEAELDAFRAPAGSTVLFGAGEPAAVARVLGFLRLHLGRELDLVERGGRSLDVQPSSVHRCRARPRGGDRERARLGAEPRLRPRLERLGARLGLHPDPPPGRAAARLPRTRARRGGGAREVRLPARGAADGRAPARWIRARARPLHRAACRRAEHPGGERLSEGLERRRPAHRCAGTRPGGDAARAGYPPPPGAGGLATERRRAARVRDSLRQP